MGTGKSALEGVGRLSGEVKAWMQEVKRQRGKEMQMSEKRMQNGYVWNALAGAVNASEAVLLSMVVTRTDGIADAGVLSIAFAVGNLMMTIGKFGVRNYQATDLKGRFSFSDYFWARIFTAGVMVLSCAGYLLYCIWSRGYGRYKAVVVAAVCLIYAAESVEDVFWGFYQQRMALDVGAKVFVCRWGLVLAAFILSLAAGKGLQKAAVAGVFVNTAAFAVLNIAAFCGFHEKIGRLHPGRTAKLLRQCAPLAVVSFLTFYLVNAPKYAIDRYLPQEVQACFGFVAMPVFVVELLNSFLYQPTLVKAAWEWKEGKRAAFQKRVLVQCLWIAGMTAGCIAGAALCGVPVLSVLFHTDLSGYRAELLILLFGGGMLAYSGYFCVLLTMMRRLKWMLYGYGGAAFFAFLLFGSIVKKGGVLGASVFYAGLLAALAAFFGAVCFREIAACKN